MNPRPPIRGYTALVLAGRRGPDDALAAAAGAPHRALLDVHGTPMLERVLPPEMEKFLIQRNPLHDLADPREIARVILFLGSEEASYMNGAIVDVNGGVR